MSYIFIDDTYVSEFAAEALVEAIEAVEHSRGLYEQAKDVPYKYRSKEFNDRLQRAEVLAETTSERAIFLLGDALITFIQDGIKAHMEKEAE